MSLYRCENAVKKGAEKFERGTAKAAVSCLERMAKAVVQDESSPATAAARVGAACAREFRKLADSRGLGLRA